MLDRIYPSLIDLELLVDSITSSSGASSATSSGATDVPPNDGMFFAIFGGIFLAMILLALIPASINLYRDNKRRKQLKEELEKDAAREAEKEKRRDGAGRSTEGGSGSGFFETHPSLKEEIRERKSGNDAEKLFGHLRSTGREHILLALRITAEGRYQRCCQKCRCDGAK